MLTALLPVLLILTATIVDLTAFKTSLAGKVILFAGNPPAALLISVLAALYFLGIKRGKK
jgi:H+/gluconate symporter-like permease